MTNNPVNDIFGQARDGSVAAIIQILNERLSEDGIRTRAIFVDGILQLLCEAPTPEQLDRPLVVGRIRKILEGIGPRRIYKVNVNSRIVREQQLLWLEEINRDPERQVLWSELFSLKQPSFFKRVLEDLKQPRQRAIFPKGVSGSDLRQRKSFMTGIVGGAAACLLLLFLTGWWLRSRWLLLGATPPADSTTALESLPQPVAATPESVPQEPLPEDYDSFARAVRIAEETALEGKEADTATEWLQLAARWQQASDLMAEVPPDDSRYNIAQDRMVSYRANSEALLEKSRELQ